MAVKSMMFTITVEYWSWRRLWTLPSEVVWTLERRAPQQWGRSHPTPPEECDSLLRPAGRAGATFWWPRLTPG